MGKCTAPAHVNPSTSHPHSGRRPQAGECLLQAPVDQLAKQCAANDTCVAFLLKPGGIINGTAQLASLAYFKSDANPSKWILTPTTIMYIEDAVAAGSPAAADGSSSGRSGGGSGLSGGAIVGIVVGAVALAAAVVAAAWVMMRRRRAAADAAAAAEDGKSLGTGSPGSKAAWQGRLDSLGGSAQQDGKAQPQLSSAADDEMLSPFGLVSAAAVGGGESRSSSSRSSGPLRPADTAHQGGTLARIVPLCAGSAQQRQQQPSSLPLAGHHHHSAPPPQVSPQLSVGGALRLQAGKQPRHGSIPVRPSSTPHQPARFSSYGRIAEGQPLGSSALPSAMLSAGLSAALPPAGSSMASSAHGMTSCGTRTGCTTQRSNESAPEVLAEVRALAAYLLAQHCLAS